MIGALGAGILFGLSAGLAPGPLLALVLAQTIRHGPGHGIRIALAPLITDAPIVAGSLLLVGLVAASDALLVVVSLVGTGFVAYLAWDTWHAQAPDRGAVDAAPRSWTRGATVNFLSPHPYLFWLTVGGPTLLAAASSGGAPAALAFLGGFYGCLLGSKVGIAVAASRARGFLGGSGYRWTMRLLAMMLAVFAIGLLREAIMLVAG